MALNGIALITLTPPLTAVGPSSGPWMLPYSQSERDRARSDPLEFAVTVKGPSPTSPLLE